MIDSGYVVGPASATDNAIARYDLTTGKLLQNSGVTINDAGQLLIIDGTAGAPGLSFPGDEDTGVFKPNNNRIAFSNGGSETVRIEASGNVGIGTISPAQKLAVNGSIGGNVIRLLTDGSAAAPSFRFNDDDNGFYTGVDQLHVVTGGLDAITVDATQNVGIGTTTPEHELDVTGDISATGSLISDGGEVQMNSVGDVVIATNAGTPESVVTADPGSLVLDTSNGLLYAKNTGTGSTGRAGS